MSFQIRTNCKIKYWKNNTAVTGVPVGPPDLTCEAQNLTPRLGAEELPVWMARIAVDPAFIIINNQDINSLTTKCWICFVDDVLAINYGFYWIVDMNVSTTYDPVFPGFKATALFLGLELASA